MELYIYANYIKIAAKKTTNNKLNMAKIRN